MAYSGRTLCALTRPIRIDFETAWGYGPLHSPSPRVKRVSLALGVRNTLLLAHLQISPHLRSTLPQVNPAPKLARRTRSPLWIRPCRWASASPMGIVAAVVLAY